MATASTIINMIAPHFASDAGKAWFIGQARLRTNDNAFGDNKEMAVALRAAHMMTKRDLAGSTSGVGGSVSNMKEGDLSIGFSQSSSSGSGNGLSQTSYGLDLIELRKGCIASIGVLGGNDDGS